MNISYGDKMLYIIVLLSLLSNIALSSYMTNVISNEGECVDKASNCLDFKDRCDVVSWLMNLCPETCLHPCIAMPISRNSMEAISKNKGGLPVISQMGLPAGRQSETPEIVTEPKPRPPSPTTRPNVTFLTYACPPDYAASYCLNGATCFTEKIEDSILYNCECADGYMGQRCEFKDLDGSYLPAREKVLLETASIAGGAIF